MSRDNFLINTLLVTLPISFLLADNVFVFCLRLLDIESRFDL